MLAVCEELIPARRQPLQASALGGPCMQQGCRHEYATKQLSALVDDGQPAWHGVCRAHGDGDLVHQLYDLVGAQGPCVLACSCQRIVATTG